MRSAETSRLHGESPPCGLHPAIISGSDAPDVVPVSKIVSAAVDTAHKVAPAGSASTVFALAAVAESGDQLEDRVECGFERFGVAVDLREEQATL